MGTLEAARADRWTAGGTAWSRLAALCNIATGGFARFAAASRLWGAAVLVSALISFELVRPLAFYAPSLRTTIETAITLCGLAGAWLFGSSFAHTRRLRDLLLLVALIDVALLHFASYVVPAAMDLHSRGLLDAAPLVGDLLMSAAVAAAVLAPPDKQVAIRGRPVALAVGTGILGAGFAELGGLALRGTLTPAGGLQRDGIAVAPRHSVELAVALGAATLLIVAAVKIIRERRKSDAHVASCLAAGCILLAAARVHYLLVPTLAPDWVAPREGVWFVGFALVLIAALRQEAHVRRAVASAAAMEERRRIARDLHDGLAQDLAFIAAHGDRLARESGDDHPLAIAARRALAISRGAIADLSASDAPTAQAALRLVADELETRLDVRIDVEGEDTGLGGEAREDVVRIAREAMVNAAHAEAQHVVVSLGRNDDRFRLRVLDDGHGIGSATIKSHPGFGLRSMRERAASLGGRLNAEQSGERGTELEVVFP